MGIQGSSNKDNVLFLSINAGAIWDKKANETNEFYREETYEKKDGSSGIRKGARYESVSGFITGVRFATHPEYGESLNILIEDGDDKFVLSTQADNRYCGDLMKMLLLMDFNKLVIIRPYDFEDAKKKRVMGVSIKQDGEKLQLRVEGSPFKDAEWFKAADKRAIKRFFEDVVDYFITRIKEEICPMFKQLEKDSTTEEKRGESKPEVKEQSEEKKEPETKVEVATDTVTPIAMKRIIRKYMTEVYPDSEMPDLKGAELIKWYTLAINFDELPIQAPSETSSNIDATDVGKSLKDQLKDLM